MLLSIYTFWLLITIASVAAISQKHHKVRHKHNTFSIRGNHVNEIREAFDEYRNVLHKTHSQNMLKPYPTISLSDAYDDLDGNFLSHKPPASEESRLSHESQKDNVRRKYPGASNELFLRNKRVYTTSTTPRATTTTIKAIENYDEEYDDDNDNDITNRRLNDDAQPGSTRVNRDVSFGRVN